MVHEYPCRIVMSRDVQPLETTFVSFYQNNILISNVEVNICEGICESLKVNEVNLKYPVAFTKIKSHDLSRTPWVNRKRPPHPTHHFVF